MKLHSKLITFSFIALAALGMASCAPGNGAADYKPFTGNPKDLTAKVTFWHTMGAENQEILNGMIRGFNTLYPNITIEHAQQGGYDDIRDKISKAIPAGQTPTMAFCYPDHVAEYMSSGAIQEMTGYINDSVIGLDKEEHEPNLGGTKDFVDAFWEEGKSYGTEYGIEDGVYSLPYAKSTEVLFYNKTFFDDNNLSVPTTWTEMEEVMKKIKELRPEDKVKALGYDSDANLLITRFEQEGIPYTSLDPENHFQFNNPEAKAIVAKIKEWYDKKYIITSGSSSNNAYTSNMFIGTDTENEVLMTIGSTGGTRYNHSNNFEVGVAAIPGGTLNDHVISQGPSVCFFARATAAEKYAAWLFYKFVTNSLNGVIYAKSTGYSPVRKSSFTHDEWYKFVNVPAADAKERLFQKTLKFNNELTSKYYTSPAFKGSSTARSSMDGILANVLLGTKTIDQAFNDALTDCLFAS